MNLTASELIEMYQLEPHIEGGYFKQTYCSTGVIHTHSERNRFKGDRHFSTGIYFLLPAGSKSRLHRIQSDEMWHFYLGGPMTIVELAPDGKLTKTTLGQDLRAGQKLQYVVQAGRWFGSYPNPGTDYSFVGCTVSPGFDYDDFELANRTEIERLFPHAVQELSTLI